MEVPMQSNLENQIRERASYQLWEAITKFELGRLQDRKVRGLGTLENAAGIHADLTKRLDNVGPVTHVLSENLIRPGFAS
jgi:hypothetical protein